MGCALGIDHLQTLPVLQKRKRRKKDQSKLYIFKANFKVQLLCANLTPLRHKHNCPTSKFGDALNPSLGMLWPYRSNGSVPGVPLTALGMGRCAHKKLLQSKTKQKDQLLPNQVIYLPSGEAQLFFATSFWTGIQLCILRENVGNKTFSGEGRNSKFLKITVKSIGKQTQDIQSPPFPFFSLPRKPFAAGFSPKC